MKAVGHTLLGVGIAVAVLASFNLGRRCSRNDQEGALKPKVDTLIVRDTIKVAEPKFISSRVVDSVPYPVHDTLRLRDTLFVILARKQIRWEDSLAVVYASGVDPKIDSIIHFTQNLIITKEIPMVKVKKTRWGVGIQVGASADRGGVFPYVGVGVSYNILTW